MDRPKEQSKLVEQIKYQIYIIIYRPFSNIVKDEWSFSKAKWYLNTVQFCNPK